ncbi:uncharacterized protein TNCV_276301 [Trichonephila clavipes]|nr:uncharacterized protein TNCV_276301 [Trichonephila clavipes]
MVCIPLTPRHREARRRWAAEHRDWKQHDWSQVLFTDESQFSVECDTLRVLVLRDRRTRNNPCNIVRVQYFVRRGFVGYRSRASSKHLSSHLPVDGARFLGGQKGVALQVQDARVGVGSTKKPTPLDVDIRRSDVTALALSYRTFPLRKV